MTSQPQVRAVRRVADAVEIDLFVPRTLEFFPDHFPRLGLVPGVVQVDWAIALAREHLPVAGAFRGVRGLKFQRPIFPDTPVTLTLARSAPHELTFAFRAPGHDCSSGRVLFAPAA